MFGTAGSGEAEKDAEIRTAVGGKPHGHDVQIHPGRQPGPARAMDKTGGCYNLIRRHPPWDI